MGDVIRRGLARSAPVLIVGSDAPGLPPRLLRAALGALVDHDVVLGPSDDGGFYVIGSRRWQPGMLDDLPWSSGDTLTATARRLRGLGWSVALTSPWFDVDEVDDLHRLAGVIGAGEIVAPATAALLEDWAWR
jgi:hypothetical protein